MNDERAPFWLLAATALAYLNALAAGFQFDDFNVIVDNPAVHSLAAWWQGMPSARPLLKLSYALNWMGSGAVAFHLINVLLHILNVALVWRLTRHFPAPADWPDARLRTARLLATVLFALHPIQTEAVTYVSGRSMSLMASFGLAGLLLWLESGAQYGVRILAGGFLLAAALVKEVAVVLPLTLLFLPSADPVHTSRARWAPALLAGGTVLILFIFFGYQRLLTETPPRSLGNNLLSELNALYYLLGQLVRPQALNIDPDLPELQNWSALSAIEATAFVLAILAAIKARRRRTWLGFGVVWFLLLLLPGYTLLPRTDLASERHLYLAGLGLYWLIGVTFSGLEGPFNLRSIRMLVGLLALAGMGSTAARNADYADEVRLWEVTTKCSPDKARAWNNLGYANSLAGRNSEARMAFEQALKLNPGLAKSRENLHVLNGGQ
jgi:tetratricopeptide (TPR) repeat protein